MMQAPSQATEEARRNGAGGLPSVSDNMASTLSGLGSSAAGDGSQGSSAAVDAQRFLAAGYDPMLSLNPILSRMANSMLPRSAPVSSLLPQIPSEGLTPQAMLALQNHLATIGGSAASLLGAGSANSSGSSDLSAVQKLLAAQVSNGSVTSSMPSSMRSGSLQRLEQHVNRLRQLQQPVPESAAVLLADAKRKEAKRNAKRLANRKSASSSRARKKALVQEMTELNARLKRQALILALLPDLVITINVEGMITFCSAQVERVLHHGIDDIVGAKLEDLLVPSSREKLNRLVMGLVASEKAAVGAAENSNSGTDQAMGNKLSAKGSGNGASGAEDSERAIVSEPSFPPSVVKVTAMQNTSAGENSDNSTSLPESKGPSSLTNTVSLPAADSSADEAGEKAKAGKKNLPSSDTSNSSGLSTTAKKLQNANHNLEKNVRAHNKKMNSLRANYRDDVTGACVTANNASARLSSLQHRPEPSSEEDSGYRESNDSREETSSSASDSFASNGRRKPVAPTCTICLVRKDLTTIWCEVTSSIRTVEPPAKDNAEFSSDDGKSGKSGGISKNAKSEEESSPSEPEVLAKELLLCLRPIRDGKKIRDGKTKVDGKLMFGVSRETSPSSAESPKSKPPKKRRPGRLSEEPPSKKAHKTEVDNDVVESLMSMKKEART